MVYEKDEDDYNGNIGYEFKMAQSIFKQSTTLITNIPAKNDSQAVEPPLTKEQEMQLNETNRLVAEGAKQFEGHEDVMRKLLGVK